MTLRAIFCFLAVTFVFHGRVKGLEVVIPGPGDEVHVFVFDEVGRELPVHAGPAHDPCGDGSDRNKLLRVKWSSSSFPVKIHFDGASLEGLAPGATNDARSAFATWDEEEHPAGSFFSEVVNSADARVRVNAGAIDGAGGTLAVTSYSYNRFTRTFVQANVTFDTAESWSILTPDDCTPGGNTFDVQDVAAHEAGHVVGLGHVSDFRLTMNTYGYPGVTLHRSPGAGDKIGIDKIY
jgi:hypothetical protein